VSKELRQKAVAAKLAADEMDAIHKSAKAELLDWCEKTGVTGFELLADDRTALASFSKVPGKVAAHVTDEAAFTAWVEQNYPTEIVTTVRPSAREKFLKDAAAIGEPVNPATGEVIPGVEVREGDPYLVTRPTAAARALMKETLEGSPLLGLTGGSDEAA
jgi:hypothetical protein